MSTVIVFPKWMEKAGAGDVTRHFQRRGFEVLQLGKYAQVMPLPATLLDETLQLFKPRNPGNTR